MSLLRIEVPRAAMDVFLKNSLLPNWFIWLSIWCNHLRIY